ncbi:gliding motility-associated ABC transporter substrate-binding protein GldG [Viscerimonas tarda]
MKILVKKELTLLLCSPVAISFLLAFLLAAGLMNWYFAGSFNILDNGYANLEPFFQLASILLLIIIPSLTMRAFAEEKKDKNWEAFKSRPVSIISLYFSKLIALWAIVLLAAIATLVYVFSVYSLSLPAGNMDMHEIIASYIALLLLGLVFVNIGLFASSLTNNQVIAFLIAIGLNFVAFYGFELFASFFASGKMELLLSSMGLSSHNELMHKGVIRFGDLLALFNYIVVFVALSLFVLSHKNKRTKKHFGATLAFFVVLNLICLFLPDFRFDFTSDKRYTLSNYSKQLLRQAAPEKAPVHFDVYLDGDMNLSFRRLQDAIKDMLTDFNGYSDNRITFGFVNPYSLGNSQEAVYSTMAQQNMKGIVLNETDREGKTSRKIIYPYAQAYCGEDTLQINLLKNIGGYSAEENLNASIENLEFEFIDAIRLLREKEPVSVAFIEGHGEWPRPHVYDAEELLSKYFFVNRGQIGRNISILDDFKVVIIAGATDQFNEQEKFILDQYLMAGGRILWLIDGVYLSWDELRQNSSTPSMKNEANLDDLLFNYGVRINPVLLQDMQCTSVVLASGEPDAGQYTEVPWYYSTLLLPSINNPVTKDISVVKAVFASSIDLINRSTPVDATILLTTSPRTHVVDIPESITFDVSAIHADASYFNQSFLPVAVSLQGRFNSAFTNRLIPDSVVMDGRLPASSSQPTKMVVASSSDVIKNELSGSQVLPMGYDRVSDRQYGNRDFIVNAVNWLAHDDEWLSLRTKQQQIRLINKQLIYSERTFYSLLNTGLPLVFVLLVTGGYSFYRKRKYEK